MARYKFDLAKIIGAHRLVAVLMNGVQLKNLGNAWAARGATTRYPISLYAIFCHLTACFRTAS